MLGCVCTAISLCLKEGGDGTDETERDSAHGVALGLVEDEDCKVPSACMSYHVCVCLCVWMRVYAFDSVTAILWHVGYRNQLRHPQQTAT